MFWRKKQPAMYIPPELQAYYQPQPAAAKKRSAVKKILLTAGILVAVIASGVGVGLVLSNHRSDPYTDNSQSTGATKNELPKTKSQPATVDGSGANSAPVGQP